MEFALFVVFFSCVFSFLFSASETALTSLGKLEMRGILAGGGWKARAIQIWLRDPSRALITVLIGNNIANSVAAAFIAVWANHLYTPMTTTIIVGGYTVVLIVLAEIVPKLLARQNPVQSAPHAMRFLNVVGIIISPLVWMAHKISVGLVYRSGKSGRDHRSIISEEELTHTIEIATKEGGIDRETGEALSNLMEFPDHCARDIMTPRSRIQGVHIGWSVEEVMKFIATDGHSRYPVVRDNLDSLVGVLLVKDLLAHLQRGNQGLWTRVVRRPYFIFEMAPLGNILRDMKRWGTHLALVRNETGVLTGLLTLEDLVEEIIGDIRDEHDDPSDGGGDRAMGDPWLVSGDIPIIDFNEKYKQRLPLEASYSTLNGYLQAKIGGEVPPIGAFIIDDEVTFRVHSVSDSGIVTVQLIFPARNG